MKTTPAEEKHSIDPFHQQTLRDAFRGTAWIGGLDLTDVGGVAYSRLFVGAMLSEMLLLLYDVYIAIEHSKFDANAGIWSTLLLIAMFICSCIVAFLLAVIMSVGNADRFEFPRARAGTSIILLIIYFSATTAARIHLMQAGDKVNTDRVFHAVYHFIACGAMLFPMVLCLMGRKSTKRCVALLADAGGLWADDDILGLVSSADVDTITFLKPENEKLWVGPNVMLGMKSFFYPQPFIEHQAKHQNDKVRDAAKSAQIVYPIRLWVAMCLSWGVVLMLTISELVLVFRYYGNRERIEEFVKDWVPGASSSDELDVFAEMLSKADDPKLYAWIEESLQDELDLINWCANQTEIWLILLMVVVPVSGLIAAWFTYVAKLAYRKTFLELVLCYPEYSFSPQKQNCCQDKKFVCYILLSIILAHNFLVLFLFIFGAVLTLPEFWTDFVKKYLGFFGTYAIYEALCIVLLPQVHKRCILAEGHLKHPRRQSAFMFFWEIFYYPHLLVTVLLKVGFGNFVVFLMFLRPDVALLPNMWEWLDSMHASYVAAIYEQLRSAQRQKDSVSAPLSDSHVAVSTVGHIAG